MANKLASVNVNVREVRTVSNVPINYVPAILGKAVDGPVGEVTWVQNNKNNPFSYSANTPVAYGVHDYLEQYDGVYFTRIVSEDAVEGTGEVLVKDVDGVEVLDAITNEAISLFTIRTLYPTDIYNGIEVGVLNDAEANTIRIHAIIGEQVHESIRAGFVFGTDDALRYQAALEACIQSFNEQNPGFVLTQTYLDKTVDSTVPRVTDVCVAAIENGNAGLGEVDEEVVQRAIHLYDNTEISINSIQFPEFQTLNNIKYALTAAAVEDNLFRVLVTAYGDTVVDVQNQIGEYPQDRQLSIYLDTFHLMGDVDNHEVPATIVVLPGFAKSYVTGEYSVPAGVRRTTLPRIKESRIKWSVADLSTLSNYLVPVNPILYKTGIGYVIWDEKTTSPEKENPYSAFIDGADLINYLVKQLRIIGNNYIFEPITFSTFGSWQLDVENLLAPLVANSVITSDYSIVMDSTNNTPETLAEHKLIGDITIRKVGVTREITINLDVYNQVDLV